MTEPKCECGNEPQDFTRGWKTPMCRECLRKTDNHWFMRSKHVMDERKWRVELHHPFYIEPNPWGHGLVLVSHYGGCNENARVCSAQNVNVPCKEDVERVVVQRGGYYAKILDKAMDYHNALFASGFAPEAGHAMTYVQTLLIEDIAERAEKCWSKRVVG